MYSDQLKRFLISTIFSILVIREYENISPNIIVISHSILISILYVFDGQLIAYNNNIDDELDKMASFLLRSILWFSLSYHIS